MRFLYRKSNGRIELYDKVFYNLPREYAILSHTWSQDEEDEVNYQDMESGHWKGKLGSKKLEWCADRAKEAGLKLFWIDTCCFNKNNSSELNETITSMYRLYRSAKVCFVYLEDINKTGFSGCKWFTRGWTLQELLAPSDVRFFTPGGKYLGDKQSLAYKIQRITGIPAGALSGEPLSNFTRIERLLWAEGRQTKRIEDKFYSLLGILQVDMYIMYGEGYRAERRLNEAIKAADEKRNSSKASTSNTAKAKKHTTKSTTSLASAKPKISDNPKAKKTARSTSRPRLSSAQGPPASVSNGFAKNPRRVQVPQRNNNRKAETRAVSQQRSRSRASTRNLSVASFNPPKKPKRRFLCF